MENKSFIVAVIFVELTVVFGLSTWTFATIAEDLSRRTTIQENKIVKQNEYIKILEDKIKELNK